MNISPNQVSSLPYETPGFNNCQKVKMALGTSCGIGLSVAVIGLPTTALLVGLAGAAAGFVKLKEKVVGFSGSNPNEQVVNLKALESLIEEKKQEDFVNNDNKNDSFQKKEFKKEKIELSDSESYSEDEDILESSELSLADCVGILKKTLQGLGPSLRKEENIFFTTKLFYFKLNGQLDKLSTPDKLQLISKFISKNHEFVSAFKYIEVGTTLDEEPIFLGIKEISRLKENLFGKNLQDFLVKNVPLNSPDALKEYVEMIDESKLLSAKEKNEVKSNIITILHRYLLEKNEMPARSPHTYLQLQAFIQIIEDLSFFDSKVMPSVTLDNTLDTPVANEDEESDSEIGSERDTTPRADFAEYHDAAMDDLRKIAAFHRLREFNSAKFDLNEFINTLNEADTLVDAIDDTHPFFHHFNKLTSRIIAKNMDNLEIFDTPTLENEVKPVFNRIFTKFGHEKFKIDVANENDQEKANEVAENELNARVRLYVNQGFSHEESKAIAQVELGMK